MTPDPLATWPSFAAAVRERLELGRASYSDRSFARPPAELAAKIEQQLFGACAWSFVLWTRLRDLAARAQRGASNDAEDRA